MHMKMLMPRLAALLACAAAFPAAAQAQTPPAAQAQAPDAFMPPRAADGRIPITVVITTDGGPPTYFRRASEEPRNVVLIDSATADASQLSGVVFSLLGAEAADTAGATRDDRLAARIRTSTPVPVFPWAEEAIRRARASALQQAHGLPRGRAVQLWLPPLRLISRSVVRTVNPPHQP
jgi:hypothetical protein